jgi:hypothetical protein
MGAFPTRSPAKKIPSAYRLLCLHIFQAFCVYFLEAQRFYEIKLKVRDTTENLNIISRSSSTFGLSNYTSLGQTQIGAKLP